MAPTTLTDIQDDIVWMSDGNVIIAVVDEAKCKRHLFKCHRSVLASRLPALKDMPDVDQSSGSTAALASDSEHIDGVPVARLYDDIADVRQLLYILYNPRCVGFRCGRDVA